MLVIVMVVAVVRSLGVVASEEKCPLNPTLPLIEFAWVAAAKATAAAIEASLREFFIVRSFCLQFLVRAIGHATFRPTPLQRLVAVPNYFI